LTATVTPGIDPQVRGRIENLSEALQQLTVALGSNGAGDLGLTKKIRDLAEVLSQLAPTPSTALDVKKINEIESRLKKVEVELPGIRKSSSDELKSALDKVDRSLGLTKDAIDLMVKTAGGIEGKIDQIRDSVDNVGPRKNIRGGR
jgi:hypothetical protein